MQMLKWTLLCTSASCGIALWGQGDPDLRRLSATTNGLAVYGATNLTLRGEPSDNARKIVKWDVNQWGTAMRNWGEGAEYQRIQEDASGRAQIYTATFACSQPAASCLSQEAGIVYLRDRDTGEARQLGYGVGAVSDNGEWVLAAADVPTPESLGPEIRRMRLSDGRTEIAVEYSRLAKYPVRRIIANNGLIAIARGGILLTWRPASPQPEKTQVDQTFESYVIDPEGQFVLGVGGGFRWEGLEPLWDTLYRMDLSTGELTAVVHAEMGIAQPDLASDGHTLVFVSAADWEGKNPQMVKQVWLADLLSDSRQQLTTETAHVKEVVLAGNGLAAFAVTENLRLLRIDLVTRQIEEIAPEYPRILAKDPVTSEWAPSGRYWLWGRGFGDSEILAGDKNAQVLTRSTDDTEVLVPIDAPLGENQVRLGANGSPFQPFGIGVAIAAEAPAFLGSSGRSVTWLHEDGVTPVTTENPARLGETVTARMTGMGPLDESSNTLASFQWSLVESYLSIRGDRRYTRTPLQVDRSRGTGELGEYVVTITLPKSLQDGSFIYEGIEVALAGGDLPKLSRLPLQLQ